MERITVGSRMGMLAAMAAATSMGAAMLAPPAQEAATPRASRRLTSMALREPNGLSWRSLKRAANSGWKSEVEIKPERRKLYLSSHARQREALREILLRTQ